MDKTDPVGDIIRVLQNFSERQLAITKDDEMGDKGGKKDKEKSKKQNANKQEQKTKGKPAQPKSK